MIRLDRLSKTFPGSVEPAVRELSLEVSEGEVVCLVGPSGCGKTTTLKMINRIIEPSSGTVHLGGRDVRSMPAHELRRGIGYVIQQVGLFPHRSVADNIATVPKLLGWDRKRITARTDELMDLVGLDASLARRYPSELSGGQQQRAGVARALAADPPVLLMDEPFSAVDPIVRTRLQDDLVALQARVGKTTVFVTHDIDEAVKIADRIAILNEGGVVEQYATPEDLLREPANAFVESFLGPERGLKRLSLIPVSSLELSRGPVVDAAAAPSEAERVMGAEGTNWVGVLDAGRLRGWAARDAVSAAATAGDALTHPFAVSVEASASLREALDALVNERNQVAVVMDGDRYAGMLFIDRISEALTR